LLDSTGKIKNQSEKLHYHVAGPLCFAGDIVARNILLPKAEQGDYIVVHDSGGYTFGMWSRYVSRLFPKIIGIKNNNYQIIRKKETPEDIYKFWSDT
jgi:diaminopimelate decarboxylase